VLNIDGELIPPSFVPLFTNMGCVSSPLTTKLPEFPEKVEANARTSSKGIPELNNARKVSALSRD
jgi:hypothetical protein